MNKTDLIEHMAKLSKLPKTTCKECLESFIKTVEVALKQGKQIALAGFGTFSVVKRQSRVGINPATGKKMTIPAKKVPKFKAGKALKDVVAK